MRTSIVKVVAILATVLFLPLLFKIPVFATPTRTPLQCQDKVAPNPATTGCKYDKPGNKIDFFWNWNGDRVGEGCNGPVGYCQSNNISDKGYLCDIVYNPPFWWQVANLTKKISEAHSYSSLPNKYSGVPAGSSEIDKNNFSVSCVGREGDKLRVDVDTRDALGNIVGVPYPYTTYPNIKSSLCVCPAAFFYSSKCTNILPDGSLPLPKKLGNANCDNKIDSLDFGLWLKIYLKGSGATEEEKSWVDFNFQTSQTTHTVDIGDAKIWLKGAKK